MTTHKQIIDRIGVPSLAEKLGVEKINIYQWRNTNSIPAGYWRSLSDQRLATLTELSFAAAERLAQKRAQSRQATA